jgi:hypothetical protein
MFRNGLKMNVIKRFFKLCYVPDNIRTLYMNYMKFLEKKNTKKYCIKIFVKINY